jgi:ribose 5-phosphate isomerase B
MDKNKPIAIGCDPNAQLLKEVIIAHLQALGYRVTDYGSDDPVYANVAFKVGEAVAQDEHVRGILLCGTGIGMTIAANKVKGVFAALVSDVYSAERAMKSNHACIITIGSNTTGAELAKMLVSAWMDSEFDPASRSGLKVQRICDYEKGGN